MTDKYAELRRLAEAATPGPWHVVLSDNATPAIQHENGCDSSDFSDLSSRVLCMPAEIVADYNSLNNAKLIAAANPSTILSLLDELEACKRTAKEFIAREIKWRIEEHNERTPDAFIGAGEVEEMISMRCADFDAAMQEQKP